MLTFHGKQEIKDRYVELVKYHREADQIIQGLYWESYGTVAKLPSGATVPNGKGCAIGCLSHGSNHRVLADEMGVPEWVLQMVDWIHEGLADSQAVNWPGRVVQALPVGVDLDESCLWNHFAISLTEFIAQHLGKLIAENISALHLRVINGNSPSSEEWHKTRTLVNAARDEVDGPSSVHDLAMTLTLAPDELDNTNPFPGFLAGEIYDVVVDTVMDIVAEEGWERAWADIASRLERVISSSDTPHSLALTVDDIQSELDEPDEII